MYVLPPAMSRDPPHRSLFGRLPRSTVTPPPSQGSCISRCIPHRILARFSSARIQQQTRRYEICVVRVTRAVVPASGSIGRATRSSTTAVHQLAPSRAAIHRSGLSSVATDQARKQSSETRVKRQYVSLRIQQWPQHQSSDNTVNESRTPADIIHDLTTRVLRVA